MGLYTVYIGTTLYESEAFTDIQVTGRENDVASAVLLADNKNGEFWTDTVDLFDTVQIAFWDSGAYRLIFYGTVREVKPLVSSSGYFTAVKCKGLGAALEETHCSGMYGYTSNQPSLSTVEDILEDLVDNYINLSYNTKYRQDHVPLIGPYSTNYTIDKTYIPTIDAALSIPFFNAPYQTCKSVIDLICTLDTAFRDGFTAGPHYFVDNFGFLRVKTIGTQQVDGGGGGGDWGKYYNGQNSNTNAKLYESIDFYEYALTKASDQYANNVVLAFDLRKPAYDYVTDGASCHTLWGSGSTLSSVTSTDAGNPRVVGSHCLKITGQNGAAEYTWYPSAKNAAWNVTAWGSEKTIPHLNFYLEKDSNVDETATHIIMFTTDVGTNFFSCQLSTWTEPDNKWIHKSIPIGPQWASSEESKQYRWTPSSANANWANINGFAVVINLAGTNNAKMYLDDWHFSGKCIREAVDTSEVTSYKEHQHVILSRTPLDDTAVASDDSGLAGQLCHAELLRRVTPPRTFTCTVPFKPFLKPGEYFTVYVGKTTAGAYKLNGVDFRTLSYTHSLAEDAGGPFTSLVMTDDVLNSFPLSPLDRRSVLNEYLLENNSKATDMQGGEVDLLIPHLRKTY